MKRQENLEALGQKISRLEKPFLSVQRKAELKNNILKQISTSDEYGVETGFAGVVGYLKKFARMLVLDTHKKVEIKENVFEAIENISQKSFFIRNLFVFNKRLISGALVVALFLGMFSYVNVDTSVVMAQTFTTLESFSGAVSVLRDEKELNVTNGMELFEGDKITTGNDGMVVVKYFDDSLTRLASNTDVIINKLFKPQGSVDTYVEVSLLDGVVWSRVLSLVGEQSAFVLKVRDVSALTQKATFNAELNGQKLELEVFNRSVDVSKNNRVERVMRGEKAVINGRVEVSKLAESEKNVSWVKTNLESDKQYLAAVEDRLLDAKVKSMGSDVSLGNSFREDVAVFLTFNDVDKQKKELDLAEKDFVSAEIKLSDPEIKSEDRADAEKALTAFSEKAKQFNDLVKEVGYSDEEYSDELKQYLDNKILTHQKELSVIMPDSPLYEVKKVVDDVALANTDNNTQLMEKKLDQVSDKLATAEDAASLGQTSVARAAVDDSKQELNNVVQMIGTMEQKAPETVGSLAPKVDEVQQYLTAVSTDPGVTAVGLTADPTANSVTTATPPATTTATTAADATIDTTSIVDPTIPIQIPTQNEYGIYIKGDKPLPPGLGGDNE